MGIPAPSSPQLKPGAKSPASPLLRATGILDAPHAGLQGDLEEIGGGPAPALSFPWSSPQSPSPESVCFKVTPFQESAPASPACSQNQGLPVINTRT